MYSLLALGLLSLAKPAIDYSGAQACKALKDEGLRVILVNSNPATIMTDPAMTDATYVEPVEWGTVAKIIEVSALMHCCRPWADKPL